jgi:hypothetical protein
MAEKKKRTGRVGGGIATSVRGTRQSPPTVKRDPKLWKKVKDPAGFWKWEKRKPTSKVVPPSVRAKREQRAKQPPPVKYASKEPKRTGKYTQPKLRPLQPRRKPRKKGSIS